MTSHYLSSGMTAESLGIKRITVSQLCESGKVPAEEIANRRLISNAVLEEFSNSHEGKRGRPRTKRKYTKRSPRSQVR